MKGVPVAVAPWIVSDGLWERIEPLLPKVERRFRYPGRKRLPDRRALQGILFVLHTGIAWRHLPLELGFGGGSTCSRRLDEWQRAGVWERLHALLLSELRAAGEIEWARGGRLPSRAGEKGGSATGPSPVDRARNGSKHHLLVDATGIPLAWSLSGGNRNDVSQIPLVERVPPVRGKVGRPRRRPKRLTADRGYDHDKYRRELHRRGIASEIARRQTRTAQGSAAPAGSSSAPWAAASPS
jgi:transposase